MLDNKNYNEEQHSHNSNNKEMCVIAKKEMCRIVDNLPNYKSKEETLKRKCVRVEDAMTESKVKKIFADENLESSKTVDLDTNLLQSQLKTMQNKSSINDVMQMGKVVFDSDSIIKEPLQPTAYNIMRRFIQKANVLTCNGRIYIYNGRYYVDSCVDDVRSLILQLFRDEIKDNSPSFVSSIVDYIKIEPDIKISDSHIRTDIVSFENGILQLQNCEFVPHNPSYITMYSICGNYIPNNVCSTPYWDDYMLKMTGGDAILLERIYQMIGYILAPDTNGKCLFLLQGIGNSGKSVLTRFLEKLFSQGAYYPIHSDKLKNQFAISELFGRALCVCQDMPNEALDMKAISILKSISGNDTISSDVKFKSAISFHCKAKIILTTNFAVISKSRDDAFFSRLVTIPCKNTVSKSEQNPNLINYLLLEKDGIITKAISAYFRLVQSGYAFAGDYLPNTAIDFNEKFSEDIAMNIYNFTMSTFEKDFDACVFTDDAYELYVSRNPNIARNNFSEIFKRICFENFGTTDGRRYKKYINKNGENVKSKNALRCILGIRLKAEYF